MAVLKSILRTRHGAPLQPYGLTRDIINKAEDARHAWAKWLADFSDQRYTDSSVNNIRQLIQVTDKLPEILPGIPEPKTQIQIPKRPDQRQQTQTRGTPPSRNTQQVNQSPAKPPAAAYVLALAAGAFLLTMLLTLSGVLAGGAALTVFASSVISGILAFAILSKQIPQGEILKQTSKAAWTMAAKTSKASHSNLSQPR